MRALRALLNGWAGRSFGPDDAIGGNRAARRGLIGPNWSAPLLGLAESDQNLLGPESGPTGLLSRHSPSGKRVLERLHCGKLWIMSRTARAVGIQRLYHYEPFNPDYLTDLLAN